METKAIRAGELRTRMHARGVTVSRLAQEARMPQPDVSAMLAGRMTPGPVRMQRLGAAIIKLRLHEEPAPDPDEPVFEVPCPIRIRQL